LWGAPSTCWFPATDSSILALPPTPHRYFASREPHTSKYHTGAVASPSPMFASPSRVFAFPASMFASPSRVFASLSRVFAFPASMFASLSRVFAFLTALRELIGRADGNQEGDALLDVEHIFVGAAVGGAFLATGTAPYSTPIPK
jgi:hypothetical protein